MQGLLCLSHPYCRKTATSAESTLPKQAKTVPAARRMVLVNAEQEGRKHIVLSRLPAGASGHGGRVYLFNRMTQGFSCICFSFSHTELQKITGPKASPFRLCFSSSKMEHETLSFTKSSLPDVTN